MKYISTRGKSAPVDFRTAVMTGLAPDGGLFLPASIPNAADKLSEWAGLTYPELACEIMRLFCDVPVGDLRRILERSYACFQRPEAVGIVPLNDYFLLELFHGPTYAFKDFALQFLGNLFEYYLRRSGARLNLLCATSGDTGSAAIAGVRGRKGIKIFVLYPHGRTSPAQERQMTTVLDKNVYCLAVRGSFDDCQNIVKSLLSDLEYREKFSLGAVNSINWARVLAQIVYYFYAYLRVRRLTGRPKIQFAVPTGNFGDIFAGYVAWRMGLPVKRLILASNRNRILPDFFRTGIYKRGRVYQTLSPSMDIQIASNFERYIYYRVGEDGEKVCRLMEQFSRTGKFAMRDMGLRAPDPLFAAGSANTAQTLSAIRRCYRANNYVLDPHAAVGVHVARGYLSKNEPMICLATAHPAKFEKAVQSALGRGLVRRGGPLAHPALEALKNKKMRRFILPADEAKIRSFIASRIQFEQP